MPMFYSCSCALGRDNPADGGTKQLLEACGQQLEACGQQLEACKQLLESWSKKTSSTAEDRRLVITSSHIFIFLTSVSMVCRPNKSTRACTIAAKAIHVAARSSYQQSSGVCCGLPAASAGPPGYVGICIKICSILLHSPFKFKSGGFRLHMKPSMKERAPYRPGLNGERESCIVLLYVQSLDYPCLVRY
jgi:hypothetical protein